MAHLQYVLASMDIQTAFDVATPKHIANITGDQDVHGWIYSGSVPRNGRLAKVRQHWQMLQTSSDNDWILSHSKTHLEQMMTDLRRRGGTWSRNLHVCGG